MPPEPGIFNILHICDWEGKYDDIDSFTDYPASVINPPLTLIDGSEIDLKRISELYKRPVMGGMNRLGNLAKGSVEECLMPMRKNSGRSLTMCTTGASGWWTPTAPVSRSRNKNQAQRSIQFSSRRP